MDDNSEVYYPRTLCRAYFNWCTANDMKPCYQGLHDFIAEVQGSQGIGNYGPIFKSIEELLKQESTQ